MTDDTGLETYEGRRDFRRTPEPSDEGDRDPSERPIFVIQEHDASSHHYDLRIEIDGVLASWAVPKGPSTDPEEKRLALPTEDHPLDYADFEGVIPEDEYGGGTVIVWDAGTCRNLRGEEGVDMGSSLDEGKVEVWLEGKKLRGGYVLVDMDGRDGWLLIKMDDEEADARRTPVSTEPESVVSGRTIEEVAEEERSSPEPGEGGDGERR